jgi:hypothetical protein
MSKSWIFPPHEVSRISGIFLVTFILRLLRNLPASARQKVLLLRPEDMSGMEECKIPVMGEGQMLPAPTGGLFAFQELQFSRGELHID